MAKTDAEAMAGGRDGGRAMHGGTPGAGRPLLVSFAAGPAGQWRIESVAGVKGESLPLHPMLSVTIGRDGASPAEGGWTLRGTTSNTRYTTRGETEALQSAQAGLSRPEATSAALIPIRKSAAWWALAQDERRAVFEEQSRHIAIGLEYLPGVARRLHHGRELGEPFDFLTWFEYAPEHSDAFERLVRRLRMVPEWDFVDREVDIRLSRA